MYTLEFNTYLKTAKVFEHDNVLFTHSNVPTVKIETNYYEIMQKDPMDDKTKPILRLPVSNTVMVIKHI